MELTILPERGHEILNDEEILSYIEALVEVISTEVIDITPLLLGWFHPCL